MIQQLDPDDFGCLLQTAGNCDVFARGGTPVAGNDAYHAFLYSSGTMQDLSSLVSAENDWILQYASGINDLGQIVGRMNNRSTGQTDAFLLTPDAAPVPEPSTMLLLGGGIAGLAFWRRKKTM
jgi:probable HAF family extracellular repeat protein